MKLFLIVLFMMLLAGCTQRVWNDPYPNSERVSNILYLSFLERPKHLDPAQAYSADAYALTAQILEPPLQYHYLKRPYTLIPQTLTAMPTLTYLDAAGKSLPATVNPDLVAESVYELHVRPGIYYQPHPAFARDGTGQPYYLPWRASDRAQIHQWQDFKHFGTRELTADDYVYEIKRLASPQVNSPIFGLMSGYIVGFKAYEAMLAHVANKAGPNDYLDLRRHDLPGAQVLDRYTYRIRLHGKYPQFLYWLAMPFFAPVPPEVDAFYHQPGMAKRNFSLDWHPVGTGPYQLTLMDPNWRMVLERNPNFHGERYPSEGEPGDAAAGLLRDAGKPLPFVDKVVFSLEKEVIPNWNKFLQGYYDFSAISSDTFAQAITPDAQGKPHPSPALQAHGITLETPTMPAVGYVGFNMLDSVVGGYSERARALRQAISIAVNYEEFISIFMNGRGIAAQGPIPPGIEGYQQGVPGMNPVVYHQVNGHIERRSLADAQQLLAVAGYPDGRDARTGSPLVLYYDNTYTGPEAKAYVDWMAKQLAKLKIQMISRSSDFNRFQDKIRRGNTQLFVAGWDADYPDPENFLFLFYGPNSKVSSGGENDANYHNPQYDALFNQMKYLDNGPEREKLIAQMLAILQQDAPWLFGYFPRQYVLSQAWVSPWKPNMIANNTLKYLQIDPGLRARRRATWNQPVWWPLGILGGGILALGVSVGYTRRKRERSLAR
jgi:ABC-type transport system substrate-binding protein